jgi:hypothetical protein
MKNINAKTFITVLAIMAGLPFSSTSLAADIWDESIDGDLSNNGGAPTLLDVSAGSNVVNGTVGVPDTLNYFTFTIEEGERLESVILLDLEANPSMAFNIFEGPTNASGCCLGSTAFQSNAIGKDLLGSRYTNTGPLGPGAYTFAPSNGSNAYSLDFRLSSVVPIPAAAWLFGSSLIGLVGMQRRQKAKA